MENILDVAQHIVKQYKSKTGNTIDQLKLQKLLYFSQKESLAISDTPLFEGELQGWKLGPVSPIVRDRFKYGKIVALTKPVSLETHYVIVNVLEQYADMDSIDLKDLSHKEYSWKVSREGLKKYDRGTRTIKIDDIRVDAKEHRPFDYTWGMYYDEFEDVVEGE